MKLSEDLIVTILETARQMGIDDRTKTLIKYRDIPGEYSDGEIKYHLEQCEKRGFIRMKKTLSADARISLTPKATEYLTKKKPL